jgi:hypothetical protein
MKTDAQPSPDPETILKEWTWKTQAMKDMTVSVCRLALDRGLGGHFSALDLTNHGACAHGGTGIAGSVFRQLAEAGIIGPVGAFVDGQFFQKRVRNPGGNPIGVWRLKSPGLALTLLRLHDPKPVQEQLAFT